MSFDWSVLNSDKYKDCIHCGMCLAQCPTYQLSLKEKHSPRGRILYMENVATGEIVPGSDFAKEMNYCLGCLACQLSCPADVPYGKLLEDAREGIEHFKLNKTNIVIRLFKKFHFRFLFRKPGRLRAYGVLLALFQRVFPVKLFQKNFFQKIPGASLLGALPRIEFRRSHQILGKTLQKHRGCEKKEVLVFTGCVQELSFPDVNADTYRLLESCGDCVSMPNSQYCCGSLHAHNGQMEMARYLARKNMSMFPAENFEAFISNSAGCSSHLKAYEHLFTDTEERRQAKKWSLKVKDVFEYLEERQVKFDLGPEEVHKYYLHEACHHKALQKGKEDSLKSALKKHCSLDFKKQKDSTFACCGAAGIYSLQNPETAQKLVDAKLQDITATDAEHILCSNPGCHLLIQQNLDKKKLKSKIQHPVSLLVRKLKEEGKLI